MAFRDEALSGSGVGIGSAFGENGPAYGDVLNFTISALSQIL
jgi:hypothetical protein